MTEERTEAGAFGARLQLTVAGAPVNLRVLTIEESDEWQRALGATLAKLDIPEQSEDGGILLGNMFVAGTAAKLEMVLAYDVEHQLGSRETVRKRMTKAELVAAFEAIVDAENPKEVDANRSVVEAFGQQTAMVAAGLGEALKFAKFSLANITSGRLLAGVSTPPPSDDVSPESNSSSSGLTDKSASNGRQKRQPSSPKSPQPTAMPT